MMIDAVIFVSFVTGEFVLSTIAFSSIFLNIFKAPDKDTSKILCALMMVLITLLKTIYVPSILVLVLERKNLIVYDLNKIALYILSGWWYINLVIPNIVALVMSLKSGIGNIELDHKKYSKKYNFIVILPVYNEDYKNLINGVSSVINMNYNKEKITMHISFDEYMETSLYKQFMEWLCDEQVYTAKEPHYFIKKDNVNIWVHRWDHSGKRGTQGKTFNFIKDDNMYNPDDTIVMLTDSDNFIENNSFNNLSYYYNKYPKKHAFSGYMSCMSKKSMVSKLQDSEYCTYELNRFFELMLGTVNCLPGAYTTLKYKSLEILAKDYWVQKDIDTLSDYHRHGLGEDRYLTHLAHKHLPKNSIGLCPVARCKTDPPRDTLSFIKQRRRWMLGAVVNEMYMITDVQIWKKYPLLLLFKIIQNSLRFTVMSQITLLYTSVKLMRSSDLMTYLIFVLSPFALVWFLSLIVSIRIKRFKVFLLWPVMMVYYTVVHILIDAYVFYSWNTRGWGTR